MTGKNSPAGRLGLLSGVFLAVIAPALGTAQAGQVRIDVSSNSFTPANVQLNEGDHVVWVWLGGSHNVASGDPGSGTPDGEFYSGPPNSNLRFSWRSGSAGTHDYYCEPHLGAGMIGQLQVVPRTSPPVVAVADFRLTEIVFNAAGDQDLIEITNHGTATGNLGRYRLAISSTAVELPLNDFPLPAGSRMVVHANASGTNDGENLYLPALPGLPDEAGSVALYVPNTTPAGLPANSALTQASMMIDFVQWGAGGQPNETTANLANLWTVGTSINGVAAGHSIEYCPNATLDHGVARWAEIEPNVGSPSDCTTPLVRDTWGRLKVIYRR